MKIYLARSSLSVDESSKLPDAQRHLSPNGRRIARDVGSVLAREGVEVDAVVTSPLVRAVQTAEILAERLGHLGVVEVLPSLSPSGFPPQLAAAQLATRGSSVLVVGHEPAISALGAFLVERPSFPPLRHVQVSLVDQGEPIWWLHPERLEKDRLLVG